MAIAKSALFHELNGSLGNLIIYKVGDQIRVRGKTSHYRDAKSETQLKQRSKVKTIAKLFSFLDLQLHVYWKQLTVGTTLSGYNLFFKENIRYAGEAEAIEDFNDFKICKGVVPLPADIEVKFHPDKQVTLKWNIQSSDVMRNHDCLQLAAFTPYKKRNPKIRIIATTETQRKAGYYAFQIPDSLEKPAYLYAFFKSKYTNEISDSYYLGGTEE